MSGDKNIPFPTEDDILAYIRDNPGKTSKRHIARAFHIRDERRIRLKALLREMADKCLLDRGHKGNLQLASALPPVLVVDIVGLDQMGDLKARPVVWKKEGSPPPITIFAENKTGRLGVGDQALVRLTPQEQNSYTARVIRKLERVSHLLLGVIQRDDTGKIYVQPTDKKNRNLYDIAPDDAAGAKDGELVLIDSRKSRKGRPDSRLRAVVKECLGKIDQPKAISLIAIHAHDILTVFSEQALAEADKAALPTLEDSRLDLRDIPLITVDPADARDHDDAIWAEPDPDPKNKDGWHVIVAIADVAHYVTPGSALDQEAWKRGNSTYFPDRVVPMLPETLSNGLCSLKAGEDRYSLAVHLWFDRRGKKIRHQFVRALIRSAAALSYEEFQAAQDGVVSDKAKPLYESVIAPLFGAYACLKLGRDYREPLNLVMPERKIILDDKGTVTGIHPRAILDAHKLVEEFMIQANVAAAEELERKNIPCIYRIHEQPGPEKLETLREFLASLGHNFAKGMVEQPKRFNAILRKVEDSPHEAVVNVIILRTQSQAIYSPENKGHFGLSLPRYAHFTSPIRRYADLTVHRALISRPAQERQKNASPEAREKLAETAAHISKTERISMIAERESTDRYIAAYMANHIGEEFPARIAGVSGAGLFVSFDETGGDGFIPISSLSGDYFRHNPDLHRLEGSNSGLVFQLGAAVVVRLKDANRITGGVLCELIDDRLSGTGWTSGRGKGRPRNKAQKGQRRRRR